MHIRLYGVRGSVPAPGTHTTRFGGNTACVVAFPDPDTLLVFDAGTGIRALGHELHAQGWDRPIHLLFTHTHWDHIIGLPFFDPLWSPNRQIVIHPLTNEQQERFRTRPIIFDEIHFPVPAGDIPCKITLAEPKSPAWSVGSATVRRIRLNHPGGAQGFRVEAPDGGVFCYLTDNEIAPPGKPTTPLEKLVEFSKGADVIVHDAQYLDAEWSTKRGWGHSMLGDVLHLGEMARPKKLILFHHDPDRDDDAIQEMEVEGRAWMQEHAPGVEVLAAREGMEYDLPIR